MSQTRLTGRLRLEPYTLPRGYTPPQPLHRPFLRRFLRRDLLILDFAHHYDYSGGCHRRSSASPAHRRAPPRPFQLVQNLDRLGCASQAGLGPLWLPSSHLLSDFDPKLKTLQTRLLTASCTRYLAKLIDPLDTTDAPSMPCQYTRVTDPADWSSHRQPVRLHRRRCIDSGERSEADIGFPHACN